MLLLRNQSFLHRFWFSSHHGGVGFFLSKCVKCHMSRSAIPGDSEKKDVRARLLPLHSFPQLVARMLIGVVNRLHDPLSQQFYSDHETKSENKLCLARMDTASHFVLYWLFDNKLG